MTIREIQIRLDADEIQKEGDWDKEIQTACSADMMSDVLAGRIKQQALLLTGLCNPQVIRTAEMMDILCVVLVRGKKPDESMKEMARERGIVLLSTEYSMFTASGILYEAGLDGGEEGKWKMR
jgi:predicted transcriptional regulator